MLTTIETIQISETTTSCRVEIGEVNFEATLDERYRQRCATAKPEARPARLAGMTELGVERDDTPTPR